MIEKINKESIMRIILVLLGFFLITFVSAVPSAYVQFNLNERLAETSNENYSIEFDYINLNNLYGYYAFGVNSESIFGNGMPYSLTMYNEGGEELSSHSFETSLFTFYDDFENETNPGGIAVTDSAVNSVIVPYNESIYMIEVFHGGELKLTFYPVGILINKTCLLAGENGTIGERCCDSYMYIGSSNRSFTCTSCGDGVCSVPENSNNCFADCKPNLNEMVCAEGYAASIFGCVEKNICGNMIVDFGEECDDGNIFGGDGCSSECQEEVCYDSDGELDIQPFVFGSVLYSGEHFDDYCTDNQTLIENYCGYKFKWDFWNIELEPKSYEQVCQYGCEMERCLTEDEVGNPTEPDLPDDPTSPNGL